MTYSKFVRDVNSLLKIKRPVILKVHVGEISQLEHDGLQWRKGKHFHISVAEEGTRCVWSLIAHEMIHCYMDENHPRAKFHGRKFRQAASLLEMHLETMGYVLNDPIFMAQDDAND